MAEHHQINAGFRPTRCFEVVLNRASGTLRESWHEDLPRELEEQFARHGVRARIRPASPSEIDAVLEEAIASGPDAVVVGGGDGTVASAAGKLAATGIPLGILPLGTFNLAARDVGIPLERDEAVAALAAATPAAVDFLEVGGRPCLCTTVLGFYPALAMRQREFHGRAWWRKLPGVVHQSVIGFRRAAPLHLNLTTAEGVKIECDTRFAALVPGEYDDVLSVIPKRRRLDAGVISIYLSRHRSLAALARATLAYLFGRLDSEGELDRLETTALQLDARRRRELPVMIDGEIETLALPIKVRLRDSALMVLRPAADP